jgi:hypothetical protein
LQGAERQVLLVGLEQQELSDAAGWLAEQAVARSEQRQLLMQRQQRRELKEVS